MSAQDKRQERGNLRVEEESQGASQTLAAWKTSGGQCQHRQDPRVMKGSKQAPNQGHRVGRVGEVSAKLALARRGLLWRA